MTKSLRNVLIFTLLLAVTGLNSGCVVGPDFATPPAPNLQLDYLANQSTAGQPKAELSNWWTSFDDPTLNELLNRAQAQNLTLREAMERIVEARANFCLQGGQLRPTGNVVSGYSYEKNSPNSRPFVAQNGDPFNLFNLGLETSWEIDLFGKIARQIEAADAEVQFQEADFAWIQQTLFADIVTSYLRIRLLQTQLALLEQNLLIQNHTLKLVTERSAAGVSTELDKSQTNSFRYRTRSIFVSLEQQLELEFNNLSLLVGQTPDSSIRDQVSIMPLPAMPTIPDVGLPADLLRRRPDLAREEAAVKAASALIGVAEADLYPQLTLLGNISLSSKNVSGLFETNGLEFSVGPAVSWNILNFRRIGFNIEAHEARFRQAVAKYQQTALSAVREVEDAMVNHKGFANQWQILSQAIESDERAVELSLERYKAGRANFQRVIDAQQQLLTDQQQSYQVRADAITQLVRLFKAAGGNWLIGGAACNSNCSPDSTAAEMLPGSFSESAELWPEMHSTMTVPQQLVPPTNVIPSANATPPANVVAPTTVTAPPGYPLQNATDPGALSTAGSPFDPENPTSVLTNPLDSSTNSVPPAPAENWLW